MISMTDCIALCGLSEEQVLAIAEHEHIPEMAAAALASALMNKSGGPEVIRGMIVDDVRSAFHAGDLAHARELLMALQQFLQAHPELRVA
jgi:hypothetical protein